MAAVSSLLFFAEGTLYFLSIGLSPSVFCYNGYLMFIWVEVLGRFCCISVPSLGFHQLYFVNLYFFDFNTAYAPVSIKKKDF